MNNSANDSNLTGFPCPDQIDYDSLRFALIVIGGTPLATIGVFTNTMLLLLFMQAKYRNSPTLYLAFLALLDVAICAMYWCIFTVDALAYYYEIRWMYHAWHRYAMELYAASKIVQMGSTYLVICATFERFILVSELTSLSSLYSPRSRRIVILVVGLCSFALRLPAYWEYSIILHDDCPVPFGGLYEFRPVLATRPSYVDYNFYVLQIIRVFIPFTTLVFLNVTIIFNLRRKLQVQRTRTLLRESGILWDICRQVETRFLDEDPTAIEEITDEKRSSSGAFFGAVNYRAHRNRLKAATLTMIAIVTIYLMCNSLDLFVKFMEHVASVPMLQNARGENTQFYTYSTDFISILFCFNSFCRIFIYATCDPELREALRRKFCTKPEDLLSRSRNASRKVTRNLEMNDHRPMPPVRSVDKQWRGEDGPESPVNPLLNKNDLAEVNYCADISPMKSHRNGIDYSRIGCSPRTEQSVVESFV